MKKIIIILILLSMISVIGCSNNQKLDEEILVEILNEQEQEIEDLKAENKMLKEGAEQLGIRLKVAEECFTSIEEAFVGWGKSGSITKQSIDQMGSGLRCLRDFFKELGLR